MEGNAAGRDEPRDVGCLGMAVEMRRETGDGERTLWRAITPGTPTRRHVVAV